MILRSLFFPLVVLLFGCASFSLNQVTTSKLVLKNGYFDGEFVKSELVFKKISWYREASLIYQINLAEVSENMPHFKWFSSAVQKDIRKCSRFYVALLYSHSNDYIYHDQVKEQLNQQGIQLYLIPNFWGILIMHPQFKKGSLHLHRGKGLCIEDEKESILLKLSGYPTEVIIE